MEKFQKRYWEREKLNTRRTPNHPVIKFFVENKIAEIKKYISLTKDITILDVGSGNGFFSYYFDKIAQTTAVDYSSKMIELNPIKNKFVMDANNLEFENNKFDIVFESCMLHHVENPEKIISEMKRVSKKYVVLLEPNCLNPLEFLFHLINKNERKAINLSIKKIETYLKNNDLKILAAFSHGCIAPNKTPIKFLKILKKIDKKIPLLGFDNIIICEK